MSVVVSDTSPLHYLVLCGVQSVLPTLFQKMVIPPTVFRELQQPNTPPAKTKRVRDKVGHTSDKSRADDRVGE